jgi:hypothetical protein
MAGAGSGGGRQLLDTRNDAKLDNFPGKREGFENWAFMFESYAHLMGWGILVDAAIVEQQPITDVGLSADARAINHDLYFLLASKVRGPAAAVVKLVDRGNGLEATRRLYKEYRTGLAEDHASLLSQILTPTWWRERSAESFTDVLLAWDELTSRYELASGERVTDAMRVATVLAHAPGEVKTLLHTASRDIRRTYSTLRQYIWEGVLSRVDRRQRPRVHGG